MNNEIIAGLRNAISRGESLDKAKKSFLNSGYNPQEVEAAASIIMNGVSNIVYPSEGKDDKTQPKQNELPPLPAPKKKKGKQKTLIIFLIILILAILGAGGYLVYLLI